MLLEKLSDTFHNNIDQSEVSFGLFLNVKKAFNTMNHDILFNKLYRYGVRGPFLTLLHSYVRDRSQEVTWISAE